VTHRAGLGRTLDGVSAHDLTEPEHEELEELAPPREVIVSTPDADAIAEAVRAFVRLRLLRRASREPDQISRSDNL
jgi:hypothetical protein